MRRGRKFVRISLAADRRRRPTRVVAGVLVAALLFARPFTPAGGRHLARHGHAGSGHGGGAGRAALAVDASTVWFNPVVRHTVDRSQLLIGACSIVIQSNFHVEPGIMVVGGANITSRSMAARRSSSCPVRRQKVDWMTMGPAPIRSWDRSSRIMPAGFNQTVEASTAKSGAAGRRRALIRCGHLVEPDAAGPGGCEGAAGEQERRHEHTCDDSRPAPPPISDQGNPRQCSTSPHATSPHVEMHPSGFWHAGTPVGSGP